MAVDEQLIIATEGRLVPIEASVPKSSSIIRGALRTGRGRVGAIITGFVVIVAAIGPAVAPYSPTAFAAPGPFSPPSGHNLLGSDILARDVLSRLLAGGWELLLMATVATCLGVAIGTAIGVFAAFEGGRRDTLLMRGVDTFLAFPQLVLALLFVSIIGPKVWLIVLAVVIGHAPQTARVMRSAGLDVCERDFVRAAESIGIPRRQVIMSEVVPNLMSPLMVELGLRLTYSVIIIAGLSFLGFGLQPPNPNWAAMINENRPGITSNPWSVAAPLIMLALLTVGINLVTDAIARASLRIDVKADPLPEPSRPDTHLE